MQQSLEKSIKPLLIISTEMKIKSGKRNGRSLCWGGGYLHINACTVWALWWLPHEWCNKCQQVRSSHLEDMLVWDQLNTGRQYKEHSPRIVATFSLAPGVSHWFCVLSPLPQREMPGRMKDSGNRKSPIYYSKRLRILMQSHNLQFFSETQIETSDFAPTQERFLNNH